MTNNENICAICLDNIIDNNTSYTLPTCNHIYHTNCIIHWFRCGNNKCPYCNDTGLTDSVYKIDNDINDFSYNYYGISKTAKIKFILKYIKKNKIPKELIKLSKRRKIALDNITLCKKDISEFENTNIIDIFNLKIKDINKTLNKFRQKLRNKKITLWRIEKEMCMFNIKPIIIVEKKLLHKEG